MALNSDNLTGDVLGPSGEYKYKGVELTPLVFADVLILLFDGKLFARQDAIDSVVAYHISHGGVASKNCYIAVFKHSVNRLLDRYAVNVAYGMWKLNYKSDLMESVPVLESDVFDDSENSERNGVDTMTMPVDKQIGDGDGAVYVYYYDAYKLLAQAGNLDKWACKVGMTNRDTLSRVFSQVGTAYPEAPHIALVIKSDAARELELVLHSVLKLWGRHMQRAPGKEWFLTSPDEVEDIYNMLARDAIDSDFENS